MVKYDIRLQAGVCLELRSLKTKPSAISNQPKRRAAFTSCDPLPTGIGSGFGWPLGDPRATQASPKGHPSVEWNKWFCLQQKLKKWRGGGEEIAEIADIARDRKSKSYH